MIVHDFSLCFIMSPHRNAVRVFTVHLLRGNVFLPSSSMLSPLTQLAYNCINVFTRSFRKCVQIALHRFPLIMHICTQSLVNQNGRYSGRKINWIWASGIAPSKLFVYVQQVTLPSSVLANLNPTQCLQHIAKQYWHCQEYVTLREHCSSQTHKVLTP